MQPQRNRETHSYGMRWDGWGNLFLPRDAFLRNAFCRVVLSLTPYPLPTKNKRAAHINARFEKIGVNFNRLARLALRVSGVENPTDKDTLCVI